MKILDEILEQDSIISEAKSKLQELHNRYVDEFAKFKVGDVLGFKQYKSDPIPIYGIVERISYNKDRDDFIEYTLRRVNKGGKRSGRDKSYYYRKESRVNLK